MNYEKLKTFEVHIMYEIRSQNLDVLVELKRKLARKLFHHRFVSS